MTVAQQSDASIGSVTELKGIGRIVRDIPYDAALSFGIESFDKANKQRIVELQNREKYSSSSSNLGLHLEFGIVKRKYFQLCMKKLKVKK